MALKYGSSSKSSKFGLRSGNGPLAFKNMGSSSPAKQFTNPDDMDRALELSKAAKEKEKQRVLNKKNEDLNSNTPERNLESEAKGRADKAKAKVDATRGTHPDQIKKQKKLDNTQKRQDKRAYKKFAKKMNLDDTPEGVYASFDEWKKSDDYTDKQTRREGRLSKNMDMTPEEYTAYKEKKKEASREEMRRTVAGLREYGPGGSGSQTEGKMKYDAAKLAQANTEKSQASQDIRDKRTQQLTEAYAANLKKEGELDPNTSAAVDENGDAKMTANEGTQAQLRKNKTT